MTTEDKRQILSDAIERAYQVIPTVPGEDMCTSEFRTLLQNLSDMAWLLERLTPVVYIEDGVAAPAPSSEPNKPNEDVAPVSAAVTEESDTPALSKEALRDRLSTYSNKYDGLDIAQIMSDMGYSKLSDIPASRYAELLGRVEAVIEEYA